MLRWDPMCTPLEFSTSTGIVDFPTSNVGPYFIYLWVLRSRTVVVTDSQLVFLYLNAANWAGVAYGARSRVVLPASLVMCATHVRSLPSIALTGLPQRQMCWIALRCYSAFFLMRFLFLFLSFSFSFLFMLMKEPCALHFYSLTLTLHLLFLKSNSISLFRVYMYYTVMKCFLIWIFNSSFYLNTG